MRSVVSRYGSALAFTVAAVGAAFLLEDLTGRFLTFPFYAAVVAGALIGIGPGILAFVLSTLAVEDFWTPPLLSLRIDPSELPAFIAFVIFTLVCLAWGSQRRRAEETLEATVEQRTADLRRSNAALQVEISERAVAEEELRRSETLLAQGQKLSRTASWTLQLPGGAMRWSAQLFDVLDLDPRREFPSYRVLNERIHPDDRQRFDEAIDQAIGDGDDFSCEARILTSGGQIKYVQAVAEVKRDATESVELIGTIIDLTERKRTEQTLRNTEAELARTLRLATLAELAAAIAHEINQPLAAITANGSACLRSLTQQPLKLDTALDAANCIVADGHRAGDVIARIRALFNKDPPQQRLLDLNDVVRHVVDLLQAELDKQRVVVRVELAKSPVMVMGDPVQLQQVVVNLVTNALEAMEGIVNRPRLLTIRAAIDATGDAMLSVEDAGCGLDPGQIPLVFDSFYTTKRHGIGVGLAISRSIIESHGGSIWAAPARRYGARVGFNLPPAAVEAKIPSRGRRATPKR